MNKKFALLGLLIAAVLLFGAVLPAITAFAGEEGDNKSPAETALEENTEGSDKALNAGTDEITAGAEDAAGDKNTAGAEDVSDDEQSDDALLADLDGGYDRVTIHVTNIVYNDPNELIERSVYINKGSGSGTASKAITPAGTQTATYLSNSHEYYGYTFTFQGVFVLATAESGIATGSPDDYRVVNRVYLIYHDADLNEPSTVMVKFEDGTIEEYYLADSPDVYISPLYSVEGADFDFKRVDRISRGSYSWSNENTFITQYSHMFPDPSQSNPVDHYRFLYWKNGDEIYEADQTYTLYTYRDGEKTVTAYAIWQPSVTVNYHVAGETAKSVESFESATVYDYTPTAPEDGLVFEGWFDGNGEKLENPTTYTAPAVTGEEEVVTKPAIYDVYAKFTPVVRTVSVEKVWDDEDDKNEARPESVTIRLLANGEDTEKALELKESDGWKGEFANLDAYADGQKIVYTVEEDEVPDYTAAVTGDADSGFTVTNKYEPKEDEPDVKPTSDTPKSDDTTGETPAEKPQAADNTKTASSQSATGDTSLTALWITVLIISGLALAGWSILNRGKRRDR